MQTIPGRFIVERIRDGVVIERTEFENTFVPGPSFLINSPCVIPPLEIPSEGYEAEHHVTSLFPVGVIHFPEPINVAFDEDLRVYPAPHDYQI